MTQGSHRWPLDELRGHHPELGQEQGHGREAGHDVHALRDPVQAGGPGGERDPAGIALEEAGVGTGQPGDREGHAEGDAEASGDLLIVQRAREAGLDPSGDTTGGRGHVRTARPNHR